MSLTLFLFRLESFDPKVDTRMACDHSQFRCVRNHDDLERSTVVLLLHLLMLRSSLVKAISDEGKSLTSITAKSISAPEVVEQCMVGVA